MLLSFLAFQMSSKNPWLVKNMKDFWFMNCPECDFKTKWQNKFEGHAVKNHPLSRTIFVYDNEESDKKEDLCGSRHVYRKKMSFQCSICDKVFGAKQTLERHLVNVHKHDPTKQKEKVDEKKKPFRCSICDKAFAAKQTLERHFANVHKHEHYLSTNHGEDNSIIVADSKTLEERMYPDLDEAETSEDDDPKTVLKPETSKRKKQEDIAIDSDELEGNTYRVIGLMFTFLDLLAHLIHDWLKLGN